MKWSPIKCRFNKELVEEAEARAERLGQLNNSIKKGKGNIEGYIGEIVFNQLFGGLSEDRKPELYEYDVLHPELNKVEIKTKRNNTDEVKPFYEGSVAAFNPSQDYNHLVFMRVNPQTWTAWFCGYIAKKYFIKYCSKVEKGSHDSRNDWTASANCWNIVYSDYCNTMLELRPLPDETTWIHDIEVL